MTTTLLLHEEELRSHWGWILALGVLTLILGTIALVMIPIATIAAVLVLGWVMVLGGVIEAIHAFRVRGWRGVSLHLRKQCGYRAWNKKRGCVEVFGTWMTTQPCGFCRKEILSRSQVQLRSENSGRL